MAMLCEYCVRSHGLALDLTGGNRNICLYNYGDYSRQEIKKIALARLSAMLIDAVSVVIEVNNYHVPVQSQHP